MALKPFTWRAACVALVLALAACDGTGGYRPWMSSDVQTAWNAGYKGKGATITVVDDYNGATFAGELTGTPDRRNHGGWTALQAGMIAPEATVRKVDYNTSTNTGYSLATGLNVINNSYGYYGPSGGNVGNLPTLEQQTVQHAQNGAAVVVIAAGNDGKNLGTVSGGQKDLLATSLIGTQSAIFVGALSKNGTTTAPASIASYSTKPGSNAQVQSQFLVVGVDAAETGLSGTSFGAPIVSGYAAILGSKFTTATPTQITNQLLSTARTDTISGYNAAVHGRGEASLSRALAPAALQ